MSLPTRNCDYCREPFEPVRVDQRFHTPACKRAWFTEQAASHVHLCYRCRKTHDPDEAAFIDVLEIWAKGQLIDDAGRREGTRVPVDAVLHELLEMVSRRRTHHGQRIAELAAQLV